MAGYLCHDKGPSSCLRAFSSAQSWACVSWKATQKFPGTSDKPKGWPQARQPTGDERCWGLACDVGPTSHSLSLKAGRYATAWGVVGRGIQV